MKNRDIYALALSILAEDGDPIDNGDYEERAGYLLGAFCSETAAVDRMLCDADGVDARGGALPIYLSMDEEFPLHHRLTGAAGYYLAAMLILEEDAELSDTLFARYCDAVSALCTGLPMKLSAIGDRYGIV